MNEKIKIYRSNTEDYHDAFQVFLDHTNQKAKAREWLETCIAELPSRRTFIDAGAGNGKVTAWFTDSFDQTIATEPNESLRKELEASSEWLKNLDRIASRLAPGGTAAVVI